MSIIIFSTMSASVRYTEWLQGGGDVPVEGRSVLIKGGAGIASKHFITPQGVGTEVTPEELELLRNDFTFKQHEANGFVKVSEGRAAKVDVEVAVSDMEGRDESAPIIPEDFKDGDPETTVKASTGKKKK